MKRSRQPAVVRYAIALNWYVILAGIVGVTVVIRDELVRPGQAFSQQALFPMGCLVLIVFAYPVMNLIAIRKCWAEVDRKSEFSGS